MKRKDNTTFIPPTPEFLDTDSKQIKKSEKNSKQTKERKAPGLFQNREASTKKTTERLPSSPAEPIAEKSVKKEPAAPSRPNDVEKNATPAKSPAKVTAQADEKKTTSTRRKHTLFQRKPLSESASELDDNLSPMEQITKKSGLTEDDVAMMIGMGYERELARQVGYDLLKNLKKERLQTNEQTDASYYRTAFGYRGQESVANNNRQSAIAAYVRDRGFVIARLAITALCTLLLFFIDQPSFLSESVMKTLFSGKQQTVHLVGLVLLATVFLVSWKQIYAGLRSFFAFQPTPYSVPAMLAPIVFLYSVLTAFISPHVLQFRFLMSTVLLLIALCDFLRINCELNALRLLTTDVPKTVLTEATPLKIKVLNNQKIVKIINDDLGKNIYEIGQSNQILGFFRRCNYMTSAARPFAIMTLLSKIFGKHSYCTTPHFSCQGGVRFDIDKQEAAQYDRNIIFKTILQGDKYDLEHCERQQLRPADA